MIGQHNAIRELLWIALALLFACLPRMRSAALSHAETQPTGVNRYTDYVAKAAPRFDIPAQWICEVMRVQSVGDRRAMPRAGTMGLMQIMLDTWNDLRIRHRLERDPFDPRDNILAGTAYLREIFDRFGSPGFLAAQNAGPERYRQNVSDGRPLPRETRAYLAKLLPMIGLAAADSNDNDVPAATDWREAPPFVPPSNETSAAFRAQGDGDESGALEAPSADDRDAPEARADGMFATRLRDEDMP